MNRQIYQLSGATNPLVTDFIPIQDMSGTTEAKKVALGSLPISTSNMTATGGTSYDFLRKDNTWGDPTGVFGLLRPYKTNRVKVEAQNWGPYSDHTIATLTGSGTITNIWWTMMNQNTLGRLLVYVDGETKPSINVDLATLCLSNHADGTSNTSFLWSVQHVHGEGGAYGSQGGYFNFPIPYSNGAIVKFRAYTQMTLCYSMVDYVSGLTAPYRLKSLNRSWNNDPLSFTIAESKDLFQTPTGSPGWFVYMAYVGDGITEGWLERNFELYVDGESSPSNVSSGTEDFFFGSFYWQGKQSISSPVAALSYKSGAKVATCVDLLELCRGVYFSNNLRLYLPTEANVGSGAHSCGYLGFFYTPSTSAWGTVSTGTTVPGNPTGVAATSGNAQATVSWIPPMDDGGTTLTGYTITSNPTGVTKTVTASNMSTTLTGLTNGSAYTFTVKALNNVGQSSGTTSNSVTPGVASGVTYLYDTFTDTNGVNLTGHTPNTVTSGATWAVSGSGAVFSISGNTAYQSAVSGNALCTALINSYRSNGTVTCDVKMGSTATANCRGVVFRGSDANNHMKVVFVNNGTTQQLELTRVISGAEVTVATWANVFAANTTYALKVIFSGTSISVYVDGTSRITYNTSTSLESNTRVGFVTWTGIDDRTGSWDNLRVTDATS